MPSRVIVNGAQGKMGRLACETLDKHPDFQLVARLTRGDNLEQAIAKTAAHIVVDLTSAEVVYENAQVIINSGAHPVIGSSGLLDEQIHTLRQDCVKRKIGGLIVPNFSISAVLMMQFAAMAAQYFPDAEIIEAHHPQKLDAPSGTAMKTADMIAAARSHRPEKRIEKALLPGARGAQHHDVPIHSIRLPGVLASQTVMFGNLGETLTITHNTLDRSSFMPGIVLACQRVQQLETLYYGLEHVMNTSDSARVKDTTL